MKNLNVYKKRLITLIGFLLFAVPLYAQTQLPECDADVPFFTFDLSGSPDTTFTTPVVERHGYCCGSTNSDLYLSFYATLHPQVAMFEIGVAPGYGEKVLVNKCQNGVNCTEAEHQKNRRTEFKVKRIRPKK